ncbi:MAG: T9SS type A sorting domain-containing protein [Bacteroidota bacterium]
MLYCCQISAQQPFTKVEVNRLKAVLGADGVLFDSSGTSGLNIKNAVVNSLANRAGIWMSATDSAGNLRLSAHNVLGGTHDFWPGPLEVNGAKAADPVIWNKSYAVTKTEINYHKQHYMDAGYTASQGIAAWPGSQGSPYAQVLAPFVDNNLSNQLYEPLLGDYPYFTSDAISYSISNDNYANHTYSGGLPLGVEVQTSLYAFNSTDSFLGNAVFVRYVVHNRSNRNYDNFRLSAVTNFKIGVTANEYLGTSIPGNAMFAINDTTEATFKEQLVSLGCMAFNHRIKSTMYFNNDNNAINGSPVSAVDFQRLMQGQWKNGASLRFGGNGIDGNDVARYIYPYTGDSENGNLMWSETSVGNTSGNRIGLMNSDSFTLNRGKALVFDFLYFYVEEKFANIKQIDYFCSSLNARLADKQMLSNDKITASKGMSFYTYPNPAKAGEKMGIFRKQEIAMGLTIYDISGREICNYNLPVTENSIILPASLISGLYYIEFKTLNTVERQILKINAY